MFHVTLDVQISRISSNNRLLKVLTNSGNTARNEIYCIPQRWRAKKQSFEGQTWCTQGFFSNLVP